MGTLADNFYPNTTPPIPLSGEDVIKRIRAETDTIAVAFSYGKDSIATYLAVKPYFKTIIPFFRMFVPGLSFVEKRLRYYEQALDIHILRVNHVAFYSMIRNHLWQPPHRVAMIDTFGIPDLEYAQVNRMVFADQGLPPDTFSAVGVRAADSLQRRATAKSRGAINWKERAFWPIWDWSHQQVGDIIAQAGLKLAPDYLYWGTSFDGLRYFFLKDIKAHYPEDYQTILKWYPFADMEFKRYMLKDEPYPYEDIV